MSRIARWRQDAQDRIKYTVDYVNWLDEGETISTVTVSGDVPVDSFVADDASVASNGQVILFYVSGGVVRREYDVYILITTSADQTKEDWVTIVVT